jgi:integrase
VEHGVNDEAKARATEASNLSVTFEQQSRTWLHAVQKRKRKPVKFRTAKTWESHLRYINSKIGHMQLADVNNRSMREFIAQMVSEDFSAKSIENYLAVIKSVVASVLNENGEPIYNVPWNSDYMDLPEIEGQNAPAFTAAEIEEILSKAEGQDRVIYALLAGSGLRIGECFALRVEDVRGSVLHVKHSAWEGTFSSPKHGKVREVDIHSDLADLLRDHIGGAKSGFVFPSDNGTPLRKSNLLRRSLHPILAELGLKPRGFHAFRRFRVAHLRKQLVPEILLRIRTARLQPTCRTSVHHTRWTGPVRPRRTCNPRLSMPRSCCEDVGRNVRDDPPSNTIRWHSVLGTRRPGGERLRNHTDFPL